MGFTEDWYPADQLAALAGLARGVTAKGHYIEVGTWEGRSAIALQRAIAPAVLYAVDTWAGNQAEAQAAGVVHPSVTAATERDVFAVFTENVREAGLSDLIIPCRMDWREFLPALYPNGGDPQWSGIAFLHLDASHDYDSVYRQIHAFYPYMLPGSVMCGDDFANASAGRADLQGGVERAVRNFFGYKVKSDGNLWWANL
jgi:hypothetical protein